jgi:hypothetical protein
MFLFFEKGRRGGVSMISKRHGKANNPYMGGEYDPDRPNNYLAYLDANNCNLYGWAMSKRLPTGGFKWMKADDLEKWRDTPCTIQIDVQYPRELHDSHNDYPLAPESQMICKVQKLVNLNKERYVVNHHALKCYESHGIRVTKVHRGITYSTTKDHG